MNAALAVLNLNIVQIGISLAVGISFFQGGRAFQSVVDTQGNDIHHMMQALEKIGTAFMIRIVVTLIAVVLIGVLLAIVAAVGMAALSG